MRSVKAFAVALALAGILAPAFARSSTVIERQPLVPQPPAEFARPYRGALVIVTVPPGQVPAQCQAEYRAAGTYDGPMTPNTLGCALPDEKHHASCRIVIPMAGYALSDRTIRLIKSHELGHCNGWPADHPNERLPT